MNSPSSGFSALQRAEIAEIVPALSDAAGRMGRFSALQRAEIAEIRIIGIRLPQRRSFSALQRAEIAEIMWLMTLTMSVAKFQCSSTSRNC